MYYNSTWYQEKYNYYVSICNSLALKEKYGLESHGGIIYCYSPLEEKTPDALDWAFIVVLSCILLILIGATILDVYLKDDQDEEHFISKISDYCQYSPCFFSIILINNLQKLFP